MRELLLAAGLALLTLSPAGAAPIASVATLQMYTEWGFPGYYGRCNHAPAVVAYEHVNSRVLLSLHSTHEVAADAQVPYTETECSISFAIEPGVTVNPCDMPFGTVSPALSTADPYLHLTTSTYGYDYYTKRVDFANGGYVILQVREATYPGSLEVLFFGECRSGSVWARFGDYFERTSVG